MKTVQKDDLRRLKKMLTWPIIVHVETGRDSSISRLSDSYCSVQRTIPAPFAFLSLKFVRKNISVALFGYFKKSVYNLWFNKCALSNGNLSGGLSRTNVFRLT